eukprot:11595468-Alexandrium_andersonii.AAC.1
MTIAVAAAEAGVTASLKVHVEGAFDRLWQAVPTGVREPVRVERRWTSNRGAEGTGEQPRGPAGRTADRPSCLLYTSPSPRD